MEKAPVDGAFKLQLLAETTQIADIRRIVVVIEHQQKIRGKRLGKSQAAANFDWANEGGQIADDAGVDDALFAIAEFLVEGDFFAGGKNLFSSRRIL